MNSENNILQQKADELRELRAKVLGLPSEKALDAVIEAEHPDALVQSFQEDDFYFLIHDIGLHDAIELLSLASARQWEYILDVESWDVDRIDLQSVTRWIHTLLAVAPKRLVQWLRDEKKEFIEFYFFKNFEITIREHDQDPSELGDGFYTDDDTFYVRPKADPSRDAIGSAGSDQENDYESIPVGDKDMERNQTLLQLIKHLSASDHILYQQILLESASILPAEVEEEEYRLRNVRLAEKGFLPFEEAVGIYKPLKPEDIKKLGQKIYVDPFDENPFRSAPQYPLTNLTIKNSFTDTLQSIEQNGISEQIEQELAGLVNQIISADQKKIKSRSALRAVVEKACAYLNIGLESLASGLPAASQKNSGEYLKKYPLALIFRTGYSAALELKWRADGWLKKSWFASQKLPLQFWGEEWTGLLGGLLIKKPLFYDKYNPGSFYREFLSTADITVSAERFNMITSFDDLFAKMDINLKPTDIYEQLDYKNLILTLWVRHQIDPGERSGKFGPINFEEFKPFFDNLWENTQVADTEQKTIKPCARELFLNWLSRRTGMEEYALYTEFGRILEDLFDELEAEYGRVSLNNLDPRYVSMFLLGQRSEI